MTIPYDKNFSAELLKIITANASAYLKDELSSLTANQRKPTSKGRGPFYIQIASSHETQIFQADDDDRAPLVITPLVNEPNDSTVALWFGLMIRFDYVNEISNYGLTHISASFVRGSQTKEVLLRAEWDSRTSGASHAQPHWHAIPGSIRKTDSVETRWSNIQSHLHLAMCAKWRKRSDVNDICHMHNLETEDALSWLQHMLVYAKQQVNYCLKKFPAKNTISDEFSTHQNRGGF